MKPRRYWCLWRNMSLFLTVIFSLACETLGTAASLEHVVVGVGRQFVELTLRHVTVARVAHHVCNQTQCDFTRLACNVHQLECVATVACPKWYGPFF